MRLFRSSSLTAASVQLPGDDAERAKIEPKVKDWQAEAWELWRALPEVSYPTAVTSAVLGRFGIGVVDSRDGRRVDLDESPRNAGARELAQQLIWWLSSETGDLTPLFTRWGLFGPVAGEARIIYTDHPTDGYSIEVVERSELATKKVRTGNDTRTVWTRQMIEGGEWIELDPTYTRVHRVWFPGRRSGEAWSPMESIRQPARTLAGLYGFLEAITKSRLARNGMVFIPSSLTVTSAIGVPDSAVKHVTDPMLRSIIYASLVSMKRTGGAADWSPIYLRGPDKAGEAIRWISMDRALAETDMKLRSELREEVATGMWLPKEYAAGGEMGSGNHWSAWADRASAQAEHWEPLADVFVKALAHDIVRPWLLMMSRSQTLPSGWQFWQLVPDTSGVALPPDPARTSLELRKEGLVSDSATRRRSGFTEADQPSVDEQIRFIGRSAANPYMATFGLDLPADFDLEMAGIVQPEAFGPDPAFGSEDYLPITPGSAGAPGDPNFSSAGGI